MYLDDVNNYYQNKNYIRFNRKHKAYIIAVVSCVFLIIAGSITGILISSSLKKSTTLSHSNVSIKYPLKGSNIIQITSKSVFDPNKIHSVYGDFGGFDFSKKLNPVINGDDSGYFKFNDYSKIPETLVINKNIKNQISDIKKNNFQNNIKVPVNISFKRGDFGEIENFNCNLNFDIFIFLQPSNTSNNSLLYFQINTFLSFSQPNNFGKPTTITRAGGYFNDIFSQNAQSLYNYKKIDIKVKQ